MPLSFFETQNQATQDYPYLLSNKENLICRSHFHRDMEIVEVIEGEILMIRDGQKLFLRAGEICVVMPEEIHSYLSSSPNRIHVMKLSCHHSVEKEDLSHLRIANPISIASSIGKSIHLTMAEIRREHTERRLGYGFAVSQHCAFILRELLRSDLAVRRPHSEQKKHTASMTVLQTVIDYIRAHYTEPISLETVAAVCGLSVYYFSHLFKDATGTTFFNYLTAYRCDKATELLRSDRRGMIDIALNCGFSDVRAFNRAFRRIYEQTPSEYRKQVR